MLTAILICLSIPVIYLIVEPGKADFAVHLSLMLWIGMAAGSYIYFRWIEHDLFSLTLIMFCFCILFLSFSGRVLFEVSDGAAMFLIFGMTIVGVTGMAALWLILTWKALMRRRDG